MRRTNMKPPVYALTFELPPPRKFMIRGFLLDVLASTIAVVCALALMIDG